MQPGKPLKLIVISRQSHLRKDYLSSQCLVIFMRQVIKRKNWKITCDAKNTHKEKQKRTCSVHFCLAFCGHMFALKISHVWLKFYKAVIKISAENWENGRKSNVTPYKTSDTGVGASRHTQSRKRSLLKHVLSASMTWNVSESWPS